ncbi:hypothetical protein [Arthrobacter polaris]|nr:hypothetical protein [Arthrobacter polaris]UIK89833.1 hypothetical protein J0916_05655 [Arthrobacter polaris]
MSKRLPGYLPGGIGVSCLILTFLGYDLFLGGFLGGDKDTTTGAVC